MHKLFSIFGLAFAVLVPNLVLAQEIEGKYVCLTQAGEFDTSLAFEDDGLVILDFVTQQMVDNSPDLSSKMNIPGEYEFKGDTLVVSFYDGFQTHIFDVEEFTISSQTMGLVDCAKQS